MAAILAKTKNLLQDEQYSALYPNHRCTESLIETTKQLLDKHRNKKTENLEKSEIQNSQKITISKPTETPLPFKSQPKLQKMNSHNMTFAAKEIVSDNNLSQSGNDYEQDSAIGEYMDDF